MESPRSQDRKRLLYAETPLLPRIDPAARWLPLAKRRHRQSSVRRTAPAGLAPLSGPGGAARFHGVYAIQNIALSLCGIRTRGLKDSKTGARPVWGHAGCVAPSA